MTQPAFRWRLVFVIMIIVLCLIYPLFYYLGPSFLTKTAIKGPRIWNGLPLSLKECTSLSCFESRLKATFTGLKKRIKGPTSTRRFLEFDYGSEELSDLLNYNCKDNFTVPPIVHYVWFSKPVMKLHEYISIYSASEFLKPCFILIHGDVIPRGKWWTMTLANITNIIHVRLAPPKEIFGIPLNYPEHKADIARLNIILKYGGIYLDLDTYVLQSFDPLRNGVLTLGIEDPGRSVANGIIIANKTSPFIQIWRHTYHTYDGSQWAANSVEMLYKLNKLLPGMARVMKGLVMLKNGSYSSAYNSNLKWDKSQYSVHLYARSAPKHSYEIEDIERLNNTFGAMSRYILFGSSELILKKQKS